MNRETNERIMAVIGADSSTPSGGCGILIRPELAAGESYPLQLTVEPVRERRGLSTRPSAIGVE